MAQLSPTWNTKRVYITYRNRLTQAMEPGTWVATATGRITNTLADGTRQVFRPGKIDSGPLNVTEGFPSFVADLPIIDDPDNSPQGGEIVVTFAFASGGSEVFRLSPSKTWPEIGDIVDGKPSAGTDLALILDPVNVPAAPPFVIKGVPGGVAALDSDGDVIDADGNKVGGGGGGGVVVLRPSEPLPDPLADGVLYLRLSA